MSKENEKPNRRYIAKVRTQEGQNGKFLKVQIDNPTPTKLDKESNQMVADQYNQGVLIWCDNKTGKKYLVKQLAVHGVGQKAAALGYVNSLCIDLDDEYHVIELQ